MIALKHVHLNNLFNHETDSIAFRIQHKMWKYADIAGTNIYFVHNNGNVLKFAMTDGRFSFVSDTGQQRITFYIDVIPNSQFVDTLSLDTPDNRLVKLDKKAATELRQKKKF